MKSNLLNEMQQLFSAECMGDTIPIPSYLFIQRYGREIQEEMQEITSLLGQKDCFFFCSVGRKSGEKLVTNFQMALERNSGIGKDYSGCILIEFSGKEEEKEIEELLDYIDSQRARLHCIYTTKTAEKVKELKELLENYGFVKVVYGEEYEVVEQMEIFEEIVTTYGFQLEEEAKEVIIDFFHKQKWEEEDRVKIRIQNMAKEIVYNRLVKEKHQDKNIKKEEVENVLHLLQESKKPKRQMGFVMGGAIVE